MLNSSIWPIDKTLSDDTIPAQGGHRSNGNERVFRILQSSNINVVFPLDCLVSYPGHLLWEGLMQSMKPQPHPNWLGRFEHADSLHKIGGKTAEWWPEETQHTDVLRHSSIGIRIAS